MKIITSNINNYKYKSWTATESWINELQQKIKVVVIAHVCSLQILSLSPLILYSSLELTALTLRFFSIFFACFVNKEAVYIRRKASQSQYHTSSTYNCKKWGNIARHEEIVTDYPCPINPWRMINVLIHMKEINDRSRLNNHCSRNICNKYDTVSWALQWQRFKFKCLKWNKRLAHIQREASMCSPKTWMKPSASYNTTPKLNKVSRFIVEKGLTH